MSSTNILPKEAINELITIIEQMEPHSAIYCSDARVPALDLLDENGCTISHVDSLKSLAALPRVQLGIVFDFLENHTSREGVELLGRLRNFNCERIWVAVTTTKDWGFQQMIGMGFKRSQVFEFGDIEIVSYQYDIASYNRKREWNNPRYWANPENWGKYRW